MHVYIPPPPSPAAATAAASIQSARPHRPWTALRLPPIRRRRADDICVFFPILGCLFLLVLTYQLLGLGAVAVVGGGIVGVIAACHLIALILLLLRSEGAAAAASSGRGRAVGVTASVAWPPGMDVAAISELPAAFRFKRQDAAELGWAQCAVCLGLVRVGESVRRLPACGHLFHARCVDRWLRGHATCPLCRAAVRAELPV